MNSKYKTLFKGKYISVISPINNPYEAIHEKNGVWVFPIIKTKNNYYIGIRSEFCPPYLIKDIRNNDRYYTVISGGKEDSESAEDTMLREVREEAGIDMIEYKTILHKKYIPVFKTSDMRVDIFILLINKMKAFSPTGDGTKNERLSNTIFVTPQQFRKLIETKDNIDYLLYSAYFLLKDYLKDIIRFD